MNVELDRVKSYTEGRLKGAEAGIARAKDITKETSLYCEGAADTAKGILGFIAELELEELEETS